MILKRPRAEWCAVMASGFCLALIVCVWPQASRAQTDQQAQAKPITNPNQQSSALRAGVTLTALEQMALKNNPTLAQAEAAIRAAEGRRKQAGLWPNPLVGYAGEEFAFRALSNKSEHFFFIEQDILTGGKLKKSQRIFEHEREQATAQSEAQRQRVLNAVRMLYYQALGAQALVEVRAELATLTREAVRVTDELFNIGQADQSDQLEIEIESQKAELDLLAAQNQQAQVWQLLAAAVGDPLLRPEPLAGDLEKDLPLFNREQMLAITLGGSPELRAAKANLEKARAAVARAKAERAPDLFVRGGLGYSTERLELGDAPFPRRTGPEATIEIGVRLPVFNRNQGGIAAAEAEQASAEREVQRVELSLRARFAAAFTNYANAARLVEGYRDVILPRAKKSFELYNASFRQMAAAYPQVLIARRSMYQMRADYLAALVMMRQEAVRLQGYLLVGGLDLPAAASGEMGKLDNEQ